jgi:YVTN family beta-propeller protein
VRGIGSGPTATHPIRAVVVSLPIPCPSLGIAVGTPSAHSAQPLLARELFETLVETGPHAASPFPTPGARAPAPTPTRGILPGTLRRPGPLDTPVVNDTLVRNVPVPLDPPSVLYDGMSGEIYVGTYGGNVSVLSDANDTEVANIPLAPGPKSLTYESRDREVFVSNVGLNNVSVIDTATNSVVATVAVAANPGMLAYDPARGTTYVPNEFQSTVSMIYQAIPAPTYPVTFAATGLPSGTSWSVTLAGGLRTSTNGSLSTSEPNGSYAYSVDPVSGFDASPASGSVPVHGQSVTLSLTFTSRLAPGQYLVTFAESGLPIATLWGVTLNGTSRQSTSDAINFTEGNGSLSFEVESVTAYTASPSRGSVDVNGAGLSLMITFQTPPNPQPGLGTGPAKIWGLPPVESWELVIGIALAALLAGVGGFLLRRRAKASPRTVTGASAPNGTSRPPPPP